MAVARDVPRHDAVVLRHGGDAPRSSLEFQLSSGDAAWLTMAVQAGFVAGTLVSALLNLPDVVNARHLFAAGCVCGAAANAALAARGRTRDR